jgi:hypothetical protein
MKTEASGAQSRDPQGGDKRASNPLKKLNRWRQTASVQNAGDQQDKVEKGTVLGA